MVHKKLSPPVTVLCRKMSAKKGTGIVHNKSRLPVLCGKIYEKKYPNGTQQITSTCNCTMQQNVCKTKYQNGTKRQFKLKILS